MLSKQRSFLPADLAIQVYGPRTPSYARPHRRTYGSSRSARVLAHSSASVAADPSFRLDVNQGRAAAERPSALV